MAQTSDDQLLVLLSARLKSFTPAEDLAGLYGLDTAAVEATLTDMAADDKAWVMHRESPARSGYLLTPAGRGEGERLLAAEVDSTGARDAVEANYQTFLGLNQPMLQLCTDWQVRDADNQVMNDHTDAAYDAAVVDRLVQIDADVQPVCAALGDILQRWSGYGARLSTALKTVQEGNVDYVTGMMVDSYHTVWFQLHEDLIATLGIDRATEGSS